MIAQSKILSIQLHLVSRTSVLPLRWPELKATALGMPTAAHSTDMGKFAPLKFVPLKFKVLADTFSVF